WYAARHHRRPGWDAGFVARTTAQLHLPYHEFAGTLAQPPSDARQHRLIRLPNNLVAVCVRDPNATTAAAALGVAIGSFADPPELMGLAHFLEHMLFMGTEAYPADNEYTAFIHANAGAYNAYTSLHETRFYFDVANGALEGALDRFAHFFIDPLFAPDCVDRELHAVDSEHKGNLQNDARRLFQIQRTLSDAAHPLSLVSTGNLHTLRGSARRRGLDLR
ncbi:metalloprotease, partial [Coemansia helicoidea]